MTFNCDTRSKSRIFAVTTAKPRSLAVAAIKASGSFKLHSRRMRAASSAMFGSTMICSQPNMPALASSIDRAVCDGQAKTSARVMTEIAPVPSSMAYLIRVKDSVETALLKYKMIALLSNKTLADIDLGNESLVVDAFNGFSCRFASLSDHDSSRHAFDLNLQVCLGDWLVPCSHGHSENLALGQSQPLTSRLGLQHLLPQPTRADVATALVADQSKLVGSHLIEHGSFVTSLTFDLLSHQIQIYCKATDCSCQIDPSSNKPSASSKPRCRMPLPTPSPLPPPQCSPPSSLR